MGGAQFWDGPTRGTVVVGTLVCTPLAAAIWARDRLV